MAISPELWPGGLEAHPTRKLTLCGTGILPVPPTPQENLSLVEQASCLFLKILRV
ncbi:hypothetical protein QUB30_01560 [Microcoleus sp. BROC3]